MYPLKRYVILYHYIQCDFAKSSCTYKSLNKIKLAAHLLCCSIDAAEADLPVLKKPIFFYDKSEEVPEVLGSILGK